MKKQLLKGIGAKAVTNVIRDFNGRRISAVEAAEMLDCSRAHLYRLRTDWLATGAMQLPLGLSGGNHAGDWPPECVEHLGKLLASSVAAGPDYALYADELSRLFGFRRNRSNVRKFCEERFPDLARRPRKEPRARRRWACGNYGELWQHDSTPVRLWGNGPAQHIIMTIDDATRRVVGCRICERETLREHFAMSEEMFSAQGTPRAFYTDGFTMFGREGEDIRTGCGRAFRALNILHLIAPTPQAKGKIERVMRTSQHRLAAVLAAEGVSDERGANAAARAHWKWWNANHENTETEMTPDSAMRGLLSAGRSMMSPPPPMPILRLFLAIHERRAVKSGNTVTFMGTDWKITPTLKKHVWLAIRPEEFYVLQDEPDPTRPERPVVLAKYRF